MKSEIFNNIPHYKLHPQMKPFVGDSYLKKRILLISESHFINHKAKVPTDRWYDESVKELNDYSLHIQNTKTAKIFLESNHNLFKNIKSALKEAGISIDSLAWYNFFQRPAKTGKSINFNSMDKQVALEVFKDVIDILKPKKIIVCSKLAYNQIKKESEIIQNTYIKYIPHPACPWWYRKTSKGTNGRKSFIKYIMD